MCVPIELFSLDQQSLFGITRENLFVSLVNRGSPVHVHFVWEWTHEGESSSRMALHLMSDTRVESEQLPGSPSMAWAVKEQASESLQALVETNLPHFVYFSMRLSLLTCDLFTTILG